MSAIIGQIIAEAMGYPLGNADEDRSRRECAETRHRRADTRRFLADTDITVTRRLGLVHHRGGADGKDVPRPATIVVDRDGVVRWELFAHNVQVRPDTREVLRAVRAL